MLAAARARCGSAYRAVPGSPGARGSCPARGCDRRHARRSGTRGRYRENRARVADDLAEARRVPHVAGEQIPVVQAVGRAAHRALPALLDFERVAQTPGVLRVMSRRTPTTRSALPALSRRTTRARARNHFCVPSAVGSEYSRFEVLVAPLKCRSNCSSTAGSSRQHQTLRCSFRAPAARADRCRATSAIDRCSRPRRARRSSPTWTARSLHRELEARFARAHRVARARALRDIFERDEQTRVLSRCYRVMGWTEMRSPQRRCRRGDGRAIRR